MEAIILAGGFGTRLAHIVKDVPKPMAPVCGVPFLTYIIDDIMNKGVKKAILAVGYKKKIIEDYFKDKYYTCDIEYSDEDKPLFTGGAIKKALNKCKDENVLVINGDTFFDVDLEDMLNFHIQNNADITVACKKMFDFDRYGTVNIEDGRITEFKEKVFIEEGIINGGIYIIKKDLLNCMQEEKFSFETDFMEKEVCNKRIYAFLSDGYFIDIGIEKDYYKAQEDFR